ncbi:putative interleukin-17 receptor E-like isoform X2 [Xyrauchen texanus]|uniref:putative interleukin-17 receptor E-like isoform X2 n=1 Tax=Xyrauchen texanus TaxID=154827 RepID=UPI002241D845|nr:putative interleukin-17 receptor E-like isoform X2 [Xyrauchen texanus]
MKHLLLMLILQIVQIHMDQMERNQDCAWHCSEGLHCKRRAYLILSTVLGCEGRTCSLQLRIATSVNITDEIRGVSVCADSAGMMGHCQIYKFVQVAGGNETGKQVDVQFKCVPVRPGQHLFVTLKTVPNYCKATWIQRHLVPECSHEGIRDEIAECISKCIHYNVTIFIELFFMIVNALMYVIIVAGKLVYTVDKTRREITVSVTHAPEDTDYNLRLCHKRSAICTGEGTHKMIKPPNVHRSITFQYSKALPCLCIEGWPARVDARRVQVCPFRNNLEELWSGISYDPYKEELKWEPLCPVKVSVSLCHADGGNNCRDLGNVFYSEGQNVIFSSMDPHPMLCTKFTTDGETWIKCPFAKGNFTVWRVQFASRDGQHWAEISSWVKANFSVALCETKPSSQCKQMERNISQIISVDSMKHTAFNFSRSACEACVCIQVQRVDVQFSVPVLQCELQCSNWCRYPERSYIQEMEKIIMLAAIILTVILAVALVGKMMIRDGGKRRTVWTKVACHGTRQ